MQQKPWFVRPIIVQNTFCCHYHVEFELYYNTFLDFGKTLWPSSPLPSTFYAFIYEILCEREGDELFYQTNVLVEKCDHCGI